MPSKIEWTDRTWNPVTGCSRASEGCDHCYAERMSKRLQAMGQPKYRDGFKVTTHPEALAEPLHWRKRERVFVCSMSDLFHPDVPFEFIAGVYGIAAACPDLTLQILTKRPERAAEFYREWWTPDRVDEFCRGGHTYTRPRLYLRHPGCSECSFHFLGCLRGRKKWHDKADNPNFRQSGQVDFFGHPDTICDCFEWSTNTHSHGVAVEMDTGEISVRQEDLTGPFPAPLSNVHLGVTAENQQRADERIPILLQIPAAVRFVSIEPMLGAVDLQKRMSRGGGYWNYLSGWWGEYIGADEGGQAMFIGPGDPGYDGPHFPGLDGVIVGGESGPGARPMKPDWARSLRDQCADARVPFFFKQWGDWVEVFDRWVKYEASRRDLSGVGLLEGDGRFTMIGDLPHFRDTHCRESDCWMRRVGKKKAGRLLDGVEHNALPTSPGTGEGQ